MPSDRDIYNLLSHTHSHLSFDQDEERIGYEEMLKMGMRDSVPFVCFLSRDSAYLDYSQPWRSHGEWAYHDYRDSNIQNFINSAIELTRRGYFALRMGAFVKYALNVEDPMIIDYAKKSRTEFLDIFLGSKCDFYLGDSCGFHAIPMIFRRPLAIVNMIPLENAPTWASNYLFIPKNLWLRDERRFMTCKEIFASGAGRFLRSEQYEKLGVEVIENKPEDIKDLAIEMDERLNGRWQTTEEDEALQKRFWDMFPKSELHGEFRARIGAEFLRQNSALLD